VHDMCRSVIQCCVVVLIERLSGLFEYLIFLFILNIQCMMCWDVHSIVTL